MDHFLSAEPSWSYPEFDAVPDRFLSGEIHDKGCLSQESSENFDFDQYVDYFLQGYAEKWDISDEDIISIVTTLSLFLAKKAKHDRIEKKLKGGKKGKKYKKVRKSGAGRHTITENYSLIKVILVILLDSTTYGDPERPLLWTSKSQRKLAAELKKYDIFVSHVTVGKLLREMGYSRKKNRKLEQIGKKHPKTDEQMKSIERKIESNIKKGIPIISIDCKKKELIGKYANQGDDYCVKPEEVLDHDFKKKNEPKASPYGIYDVTSNIGYINLGLSSETAEFAVHSIEKWWDELGSKLHKSSSSILITCDAGGSNSATSIRFKLKLQEFANKTGLRIDVSHYPPGKSKYNKIEHRLFNHISNNWRGHPLINIDTILKYIKSTKTKTGLIVHSSLDSNVYETGLPSNNKDLRNGLLLYDDFLPQWNYSLFPESRREEVQSSVIKQWEMIDKIKKEIKKNKKNDV